MMFLSAVDTVVIWTVVPIIVVQYAFAIFCLLKLAYFDVSKKEYVLWNLFILIVFFIGGIAFLIYYYKHPDRRVKPLSQSGGEAEQQPSENKDETPTADDGEKPEADEQSVDADGEKTDEDTKSE